MPNTIDALATVTELEPVVRRHYDAFNTKLSQLEDTIAATEDREEVIQKLGEMRLRIDSSLRRIDHMLALINS